MRARVEARERSRFRGSGCDSERAGSCARRRDRRHRRRDELEEDAASLEPSRTAGRVGPMPARRCSPVPVAQARAGQRLDTPYHECLFYESGAKPLCADVAQLAEQLICNQQVASSILAVGSAARARVCTQRCGSGGVPKRPTGADCKSAGSRLRRFESFPHHRRSRGSGTATSEVCVRDRSRYRRGSSSVGRAQAFQA